MSYFPATLVYKENTDHDAWVNIEVTDPETLRVAISDMKKYYGGDPYVVDSQGVVVSVSTALWWSE